MECYNDLINPINGTKNFNILVESEKDIFDKTNL